MGAWLPRIIMTHEEYVQPLECRTVMTAMLTVMNSMDPHTIRVTWIGMVEMLGVSQSCA
jgi:hypothetical protein